MRANSCDMVGLSKMAYLVREVEEKRKRASRGMFPANKEDVMRLVEAQIAGNVDLSPEEMVEAAFLMVRKINQKIYEEKIAQTR